jgi:hypothetical protein
LLTRSARRLGQKPVVFVPGARANVLTSVIGIMRLQSPSLWRHPPGWVCLVLLAGLGFSQPVAAAPPAVLPLAECSYSLHEAGSVSPSTAAFRPVIGAAWYDTMYNKMQSWLSNQRHMIQFGCIGMIVALFIIWWRKT